ncbi:MAG: ATP-dependent DNA helicase [Clostridium sp.]|nr:ATP-dependent DNA helicase [Clostridium sp.]
MQNHISVRSLVEFLLRGGDIDNRHAAQDQNAMQAGSRIHREIQRSMGPEYRAEVSLSHTVSLERYELVIEGRADGIFVKDGNVTVDEIKGTYRGLPKIKEPIPVHLAQAKCYAYIYARQQALSEIHVRMTYCHLETEAVKYFEEAYSFEELSLWFEALIAEYRKWSDYRMDWLEKRNAALKELAFPFPYREGQKELVTYVYQTIYHKRKLFIEAPTGVGKTISTMYPALKALGEGRADRLFYLTAKTITRTVADDTLRLLSERGMCLKRVLLTAKEKICPQAETVCNPEACPYAKGHFDRINDCLYDCLTKEDSFTREVIERYAEAYRVCPFEMSLDMSLFSDAVICDYNYVFDPHVYLKRFFAEGNTERYLFLIDEAHNLVERGREMYSAVLYKEDFLKLKGVVRGILHEDGEKEVSAARKASAALLLAPHHAAQLHEISRLLDRCNKELLARKRECEGCVTNPELDSLILTLNRLSEAMSKYLENTDSGAMPGREEILDFYFEVSHFLMIAELVDEHYVPYMQSDEEGRFLVKLFCVDPSRNLQECMGRAVSSVLFSATMLPIQYYKKLLGGTEEDYEVYAGSTFDDRKRGIYIADDVTSKYTRRGEDEYRRVAKYVRRIVDCRYGNYMIFFPSHQFLRQVYEIFIKEEYDETYMDCIVQEGTMDERAREAFLARFSGAGEQAEERAQALADGKQAEEKAQALADEKAESGAPGGGQQAVAAPAPEADVDRCLIGFCVLGGLFGEGIDLKRDALIGVVIVGTGLPQVCAERAILKDYFDGDGGVGFDYAYRYPGMNKVLQAAGRVIRTAEDVGIVALLDYRFCRPEYRAMFPREWKSYEQVRLDTIGRRIERFWDEWL